MTSSIFFSSEYFKMENLFFFFNVVLFSISFVNILSLSTKPLSWVFFVLFCFVFNLFNLFYFWLRWVFIAVRGLSLVAASGGYSSLRCTGFSLRCLLLLRSTGSRHAGSVVVAHGLSCSAARGIFPDQGSNTCPLHWQVDS